MVRINLYNCRTAQVILWENMRELKADMALISEPCSAIDTYSWLAAAIYGPAIWIPGNKALQRKPLVHRRDIHGRKYTAISLLAAMHHRELP